MSSAEEVHSDYFVVLVSILFDINSLYFQSMFLFSHSALRSQTSYLFIGYVNYEECF